MTIREALEICDKFRKSNGNYDEDDFFVYTEALKYLIDETTDPEYMFELGGAYYYEKEYELALKYYEMTVEYDKDNTAALGGLGYIWYYGRTGTVDYKKAFEYYSSAAKAGCDISRYKVADMYRYGQYVNQDFEKFKEIIESLYNYYHWTDMVDDPLPEICIRLAAVREKEGKTQEAVSLLLEGKSMLSSRIGFDHFFGNFAIMENMVSDLYRLTEFDRTNFDLYDLYYLMKEPAKIRFSYNEREYIVESVLEDDGTISICFDGKWYHTLTDALMATQGDDGNYVTLDAWKMKDFEVIE
ncbi:hypothetical protein SAMN02910353_02815 [Ruminococcus sp. YRD2003]|uniref:tetratricopeptide repeat protein n=1 Tax=Ruminococcus sp. YRD2003 TaxID=1452313 RepID=UPI0008AE6F47|nr:hypothetical protein SAMN02910353_02815 [Ruminococcus flavefaciens]